MRLIVRNFPKSLRLAESCNSMQCGGVAERSNALAWKAGVPQGTAGSNPVSSALHRRKRVYRKVPQVFKINMMGYKFILKSPVEIFFEIYNEQKIQLGY